MSRGGATYGGPVDTQQKYSKTSIYTHRANLADFTSLDSECERIFLVPTVYIHLAMYGTAWIGYIIKTTGGNYHKFNYFCDFIHEKGWTQKCHYLSQLMLNICLLTMKFRSKLSYRKLRDKFHGVVSNETMNILMIIKLVLIKRWSAKWIMTLVKLSMIMFYEWKIF